LTFADQTIIYEYHDHRREGWEHKLTLVGRETHYWYRGGASYFSCKSGIGHGAAEGIGGPHRWEDLKEAYATDEPTDKQLKLREWYETKAVNGDPMGLTADLINECDVDNINEKLKWLPVTPLG